MKNFVQWLMPILLMSILLKLGACRNKESGELLPSQAPLAPVKIIEDFVAGDTIILVGSQSEGFINAFYKNLQGKPIEVETVNKPLPVLFKDQFDNFYDVFGNVIQGKDKGAQLKTVPSATGYWFAMSTFYPTIPLHNFPTNDTNLPTFDNSGNWLLSTDYLAQVAEHDAIKPIDNPRYVSLNSKDRISNSYGLEDDDRVIVIQIKDKIYAYPTPILDIHKVLNDSKDNTPFCVTYGPFTGTPKAWYRRLDGETFTFGISSYIYNNNLIPFDRETDSYWTQYNATSVFGQNKGKSLLTIPYIDMTWQAVLKMYPEQTQLMIGDQTIDRTYEYPYGDYRSSNRINHPISFIDERLHPKEIVFVIHLDNARKAYRYDDF